MIEYQSQPVQETQKVKADQPVLSIGKVFLWMALGLIISGVISLTLPDILGLIYQQDFLASEGALTTYVVMLVASLIVMIPISIIMNIGARKESNKQRSSIGMIIAYVIYAIAMGVLLSSVMLFAYLYLEGDNIAFTKTIATSFLITAACFGVMGILGILFKKMNAAIPVVITAIVGIIVLTIVNIFLQSEMVYWIIDFVLFAVILLSTAIDMHNIYRIAQSGTFKTSNNLALYCGFVLYVDFMNILIRVIYYVLIATNKN